MSRCSIRNYDGRKSANISLEPENINTMTVGGWYDNEIYNGAANLPACHIDGGTGNLLTCLRWDRGFTAAGARQRREWLRHIGAFRRKTSSITACSWNFPFQQPSDKGNRFPNKRSQRLTMVINGRSFRHYER